MRLTFLLHKLTFISPTAKHHSPQGYIISEGNIICRRQTSLPPTAARGNPLRHGGRTRRATSPREPLPDSGAEFLSRKIKTFQAEIFEFSFFRGVRGASIAAWGRRFCFLQTENKTGAPRRGAPPRPRTGASVTFFARSLNESCRRRRWKSPPRIRKLFPAS